MLDISTANPHRTTLAWVGNKFRYEGVATPTATSPPDALAEEILLATMLNPFRKMENYFYFADGDEAENQVKVAITEIFENPADALLSIGITKRLAHLLYEQMDFPRAIGGEFFVCKFDDIMWNGEPVSAIGLWKVNTHTNIITTNRNPQTFSMEVKLGIDTSKVEQAALILNVESEEGYRVMAIDQFTKQGERSFWLDGFLRLRPLEDEYYFTRHLMNAVDEFVRSKAALKYGLTRPEKFALLNRISDKFKYNDEFEINDFLTVFENEEMAKDFQSQLAAYTTAYGVHIEDAFELSPSAKKNGLKLFRTALKLDRNFTLTVTTSRKDLLQTGISEESGKRYYQVYYDDETVRT